VLFRSKQRIIDLFSVIDWMMQVPKELQNQLWQDIEQLERNKTMPYITSVERIGIEKGLQQGSRIRSPRGRAAGGATAASTVPGTCRGAWGREQNGGHRATRAYRGARSAPEPPGAPHTPE
jgi:hypothetical protein